MIIWSAERVLMTVRTSIAVTAASLAFLTSLAACSGVGKSPPALATVTVTESLGPTDSSDAQALARLWSRGPCAVLPDQQAANQGYYSKSQLTAGDVVSCEYSMPAAPDVMLIVTFSETGIGELRHPTSAAVASRVIGSHQVVGVKSGDSPLCTFTIAIGERRSVGVQGKADTADEACRNAGWAVEQIEPLLP